MASSLPCPPSAISEALDRYKRRHVRDTEADPHDEESKKAAGASSSDPSAPRPLTLFALDAVAQNFHLFPNLEGLDPKFVTAITSKLPLDLDVLVSGPHVNDEHYWKRVCLEGQAWENCQISEHGMSWKQLFFERYISSVLESFGSYAGNSRTHEDEMLRPPIDSTHPRWKLLYPDVPAKVPPSKVLPTRERFCCRGVDCDAIRIMNSPNSGWPGLERCKSVVPTNIQQYSESYAWATVTAEDKAECAALDAAHEAALAGSLGTTVATTTGSGAGAAAGAGGTADEAAVAEEEELDANVLREYVAPADLAEFQITGLWPKKTNMCLLCSRAHELDRLAKVVKVGEDFVFSLRLAQMLSHLDWEIVFSRLPNLSALELTYGVRKIGMKYDRSLFGIKISDAMSLAKCIRATETLTTLVLPCNMIDDDLLRMLMTGLIRNQTITYLDLSHNNITNYGVRLLSKLIGPKSVLMSLVLADNQVHADGGKYLGRALKRNDSLTELNLRLNRLEDEGGRMLLEGARYNNSLTSLNLSSNALRETSGEALSAVLASDLPLVSLDLSGNMMDDRSAQLISSALKTNTTLTALDFRSNEGLPSESLHLAAINKATRQNELGSRRA